MSSARDTIATNRKATHDYFVTERLEAGIELTGAEVKSLRQNSASMRDSFVTIRGGEAWMSGVHIAPYSHACSFDDEPDRRRRLLLHKRQIEKLARDADRAGYTIVPLSMYFNEQGRVKVEIGVCKGKRAYDKRESIKRRDEARDVERALKERSR